MHVATTLAPSPIPRSSREFLGQIRFHELLFRSAVVTGFILCLPWFVKTSFGLSSSVRAETLLADNGNIRVDPQRTKALRYEARNSYSRISTFTLKCTAGDSERCGGCSRFCFFPSSYFFVLTCSGTMCVPFPMVVRSEEPSGAVIILPN